MTIPVECKCGCVIDTAKQTFSRVCKKHQGEANEAAREQMLEYANKQMRRKDDEED